MLEEYIAKNLADSREIFEQQSSLLIGEDDENRDSEQDGGQEGSQVSESVD